jgi:hypothetical protein
MERAFIYSKAVVAALPNPQRTPCNHGFATAFFDGPRGEAKILALRSNTLRSRMKKLGILRALHEAARLGWKNIADGFSRG